MLTRVNITLLVIYPFLGGPNRFVVSEFHTKCPNFDNALWWWPSWISDPHKKGKFVRDYAMTFHVQLVQSNF